MSDELTILVLTVVADDYESFAIIMDELEKWIGKPSEEHVAETLAELTANEDVKAYYLSPQTPHCVDAPFDTEQLDTLWFYITPKGLERLKRMEAEIIRSVI